MSDAMQEQINNAINQHLPTQVGEALRKRLQQADACDQENRNMREDLKQLLNEVNRKQEMLNKHDELDRREYEAKQRADAILLRELSLSKHDAELRAECAEKSLGQIFALVDKLFSNPVMKRRKIGEMPVREHFNDGSEYINTQHVEIEESETTE